MVGLRAVLRPLCSAIALICLFTTAPANETTWYKFCIDIYILVKPGAGEADPSVNFFQSILGPDGRWTQPETNLSIPKAQFKDGIATFNPGDAIPGGDSLGPLIASMFRDMNQISKDCKLWFEGARVHFVDPGQVQVKTNGEDKKRPLSEWLKFDEDSGMPTADPNKVIDNQNFLSAFGKIADTKDLKSNCLSMAIVNFAGSGGEMGKAAAPGNQSMVDLGELTNPNRGGFTPTHEVLHNLGMATGHDMKEGRNLPRTQKNPATGRDEEIDYHNTDHNVEPGANGAIDVLAHGIQENQGTRYLTLKPFIRPEDCIKLCSYIAARERYQHLVRPEQQDPPANYLAVPDPVRVATPATSEQDCTPDAPAGDAAPPVQKVPVSELPLPDKATTAAQFAEMAGVWRANIPATPEDCCGAKTVGDKTKAVKDMLARLKRAEDLIRQEYTRALAGETDRDTSVRLRDLVKAIGDLKKELIQRRNELSGMEAKLKKDGGGQERCDHSVSFLPGTPFYPADPYERAYAVKFAYSEPERCVATTYYVGETVHVAENQPFYDFGSPVSIAVIPKVTDQPGTTIAECPPEFSVPISYAPPHETPESDEPSAPEPGQVTIVDEPVENPATETPRETPQDDATTETPSPPPGEELPPTTEIVEAPSLPSAPESGDPDLGLVKAEASVIKLVFEDGDTGQAISQGVVKLLDDVPEIPDGDDERDPLLTSREHYAQDSEGAQLSEDGSISLKLEPDGTSAAGPSVVKDNAAPDSAELKAAIVQAIKLPPRTQTELIIAGIAKDSRAIFPISKGQLPTLSANLVPAGTRICVKRKFTIGDTPAYVVSLPVEVIDHFTERATSEGYSFVEPDPCRNKESPNDPLYEGKGLWGQDFDNQWAIKRVGFDGQRLPAWPGAAAELAPVTVAVIDSGLDWYHPDFPPSALWRNIEETPGNGIDDDGNGYIDDDIGWNFINGNRQPWDYDGHGTFVSGIIAAGSNNGIGIAGINPAARIMVLKALDAFGRGQASLVAEAIAYAADNGAGIINLSLGGRGLTQIEQLAVSHARSKGVIVVAAAGNDAKEVTEFAPAGLDGVVTVSATDRRDRRAGFSNWGPSVDIAAPGVDVLSLRARRTDLLSLIPGVSYDAGQGIVGENHAYFRASGTSFAAPIVTATAALIRAQRPDLDAAAVTRMVLQSAQDIETAGFDNYTGYGLLDAAAALSADPTYFVEARITGVEVVKTSGKPGLRLKGTADADRFKRATLMIGQGENPSKWLRIDRSIAKSKSDEALMDLPASFFKGGRIWTLRLVTEHQDGTTREARFVLKLG